MTVSARLEPDHVPVQPGDTGQVTVHLRNGGEIVEAYRIEVVGDPAAWCAVEPAELSLYPGTAGTATLTLAPPRAPEPGAGPLPFAVRVLPAERPDGVQVPEGSVEVLPFRELGIELTRRTRRARFGARYQIAVRNLGNVPAPVQITAQDPDGKLRLRAHPAAEELGPAELGHFRVLARPRRTVWKGRPQSLAFQLAVAQEGAETETAECRLEQRPVLPQNSVKALIALAAVAAGLAAAWLALVKPAIATAADAAAGAQASQAAASATAAARASQAAASAAAAAATLHEAGTSPSVHAAAAATPKATEAPSASPKASPSPTPTPTHSTPTPTPTPTKTADYYKALSAQTNSGATSTVTFTVPANSTFLLTDFVLENPQGDNGTVALNIDGTQVALLALEDFRDSDNPWVTPLEVPAGGTVSMVVDCTLPGSPPDTAQPKTCTESAVLNGSMVTVGS